MKRYEYSEFLIDVKSLSSQLQEYSPQAILSIARGGVTLGHFLSILLNIREFYTINSIYYNDTHKYDNIEIFNIPDLSKYEKIILVDDIVDSGVTMDEVVRVLTNKYKTLQIQTVSLFYKQSAIVKPDFYIHEAKEWIEFFWENL